MVSFYEYKNIVLSKEERFKYPIQIFTFFRGSKMIIMEKILKFYRSLELSDKYVVGVVLPAAIIFGYNLLSSQMNKAHFNHAPQEQISYYSNQNLVKSSSSLSDKIDFNELKNK